MDSFQTETSPARTLFELRSPQTRGKCGNFTPLNRNGECALNGA